MARNQGGKHKHLKKGGFQNSRALQIRQASEIYAQVEKPLGNSFIKCKIVGKNEMIVAKIRGKLQKRTWINAGNIVLVQKSEDFGNDSHGWIIHLYWPDEVRELKKMGELPLDLEVVEKVENDKTGLEIAFNKDQDGEVEEVKQAPKIGMDQLMPGSDSEDYEENSQRKEDSDSSGEEQEESESEEEKDELADI